LVLFDGNPRFYASYPVLLKSGEMPELAEGARLEIVCSAKSGTVGSNPTLSATQNGTRMNAEKTDESIEKKRSFGALK
jgi:hypothetical protein